MTAAAAPAPFLPGRLSGGQAALWTGAAALAFTVHAGAVAWALRQPPPLSIDPEPAPAMIIDLEPATVAPEAPVETLAADSMDAPEIEQSLPEIAVLEPPPTPPDVPLEPTPVETADVLPAIEPPPDLPAPVTRPAARPRDLEFAKVEEPPPPEKIERKKKPEPDSRARTRAASPAAPAKVATAPAAASGASASVSPARWQARLMAHLERRKKYPAGARKRREEGNVLVRFAIDGNGNVLSSGLVRSSGHPELDEAVLALVRRASPVPAPPPGAPQQITAPVKFSIR
ncbi:MAG TPA: TonB family protein [Amaricoccus sp.]|nr:TonB family protein [Amaricoccus sp.]